MPGIVVEKRKKPPENGPIQAREVRFGIRLFRNLIMERGMSIQSIAA
jgi:hypothetical protein